MENRRKFLGSCVAGVGLLACATAPSLVAKPAHAKAAEIRGDHKYVMLRKTYSEVKISKTGVVITSKRNLFQPISFTGIEASVVGVISHKQCSVSQLTRAIANAYRVDINTANTVVSRVLSRLEKSKMLIKTPIENKQKTILIYLFSNEG